MKKRDDTPSCADCRFWVEGTESGDTERWGFCRRFPPTVTQASEEEGGAQCVSAWTVLPYECGEHKPRLQ